MIFNSVVIVLSLVSFVCLCFFVSERRKIQSEKNYCSLSFPLAILCSQFVELRLQFQADPLPLKALSAWHIQTHEQRQTLKMNLSSTHSEMCIFEHTVSVHCTHKALFQSVYIVTYYYKLVDIQMHVQYCFHKERRNTESKYVFCIDTLTYSV